MLNKGLRHAITILFWCFYLKASLQTFVKATNGVVCPPEGVASPSLVAHSQHELTVPAASWPSLLRFRWLKCGEKQQ